MGRYLARRLVSLVPTLLGVSLLTFLFLRLIPGDAIAVRLGTATVLSPEQLAELRAYLGLDRPLHVQYLGWLGAVLRGDAGYSLRTGQPVLREIAARLPVTIELALAAALVALAIGLPLGILSALRPRTRLAFDPARTPNRTIRWDRARVVNGRCFYVMEMGGAQELWVSDGTQAGTVRVVDLAPGPRGSSPSRLTPVGDRLLFAADDGRSGQELWLTDGTAEGTWQVDDTAQGLVASGPEALTLDGERVFFEADDGARRGLFVLDLAAARAGLVFADGFESADASAEPSTAACTNESAIEPDWSTSRITSRIAAARLRRRWPIRSSTITVLCCGW